MKFAGAAGLAAVIIGVIGVAAVISSVASTFTRETSGMTDRWGYASVTERDKLSNFMQQFAGTIPCTEADSDSDGDGFCNSIETLYSTDPNDPNSKPYYDANISTSSTNPPLGGFRGNGNDYDNDGLPNDVDPDPTDPDTDGDWTIDGKDTNPTDPTEGGVEKPPVEQPRTKTPRLILDKLYKVVMGPYSNGKWTHVAEARLGDTVNFRIHAEVTNEGGIHTLVIEDYLPGGLTFISGTFTQNNAEPSPLTYAQLRHREIRLLGSGHYTFEINFTAKTASVGNNSNRVNMFEIGGDNMDDQAFVNIRSADEAIGGGFGQICVICNLYKYGRIGSTPWSTRVKANTGNTVEFSINVEGGTPDSDNQPTTIQLVDLLPEGMRYIKGSSQLFRDGTPIDITEGDNWINVGTTLIPTSRQTTFELRFSAKVEASVPFSMVNTVKADSGGNKPNSRVATTTIVSN